MNSVSLVLSIALAVLSTVTLAIVYAGVQGGVELNKERSGAQLMLVSREAANEISSEALLFTGSPAPIYFDKALAEKVANMDGISRSSAQFYGQTLDESCCSTDGATRLIGVDFSTDWTVSAFAHINIDGPLGGNTVIAGKGVANKPGETIRILGASYTIADVLDSSGTELDNAILMDIDLVRSICGLQEDFAHYWETYGSPASLVSCILIDSDLEGFHRDLLINRLSSIKELSLVQRDDVVNRAQDNLSTLFSVMLIVGILLIAASIVQLFARFYSCVWERKTELALYSAIGASRADLKRMIGLEMALLLGEGVVVGAGGGIVLQGVLVNMLTANSAFPFVAVSPLGIIGIVAAVAIFFGLIGIASIFWPLRQINRLQPSVAMQQADID